MSGGDPYWFLRLTVQKLTTGLAGGLDKPLGPPAARDKVSGRVFATERSAIYPPMWLRFPRPMLVILVEEQCATVAIALASERADHVKLDEDLTVEIDDYTVLLS